MNGASLVMAKAYAQHSRGQEPLRFSVRAIVTVIL